MISFAEQLRSGRQLLKNMKKESQDFAVSVFFIIFASY